MLSEQADESVANASRSEVPQQTQTSSSDDTSVDQQPSGNVEAEEGWRPPPQPLEATTSLEAQKGLDKEENKDPVQDFHTAEREKEKDIEDSSSHNPSKRREKQRVSPIRPGRPWRPGLPTGCRDH